MNQRVKPFRILRGIEVNIRADGSLDVDDDVLAQLDWVVASVHTAFDRSPTERSWGRSTIRTSTASDISPAAGS